MTLPKIAEYEIGDRRPIDSHEFRKTADEIQDTVDSLMALDQEMQS